MAHLLAILGQVQRQLIDQGQKPDSQILCTAMSIFKRVKPQAIPRNETVMISNKSIRLIEFFYGACVLLAAKLHGQIYSPTSLAPWLKGFESHFLCPPKPSRAVLPEKTSSSATPFRVDSKIFQIVHRFEIAILKSLDFALFLPSIKELFESKEFCPTQQLPSVPLSLLSTLVEAYAAQKYYVVIDAHLLITSAYDSKLTTRLYAIEDYATKIKESNQLLLQFLQLLRTQNVPVYLIDLNDAITSLGEGLFGEIQNDTRTLSSRASSISESPSLYSKLKRFFPFPRSTSDRPSYAEKAPPRIEVSTNLNSLSGPFFYEKLFGELDWTNEQEQPILLTFDLKHYSLMSQGNDEQSGSLDFAPIDTLNWFSLLHGQELLRLV